jgi:integrase
MPIIKMTAASLARLKPPAAGQVDFFDHSYPGLALRVSAGDVRSWTYFGRVHGKLKRATLGRFPAMSLAQARRKAGEIAEAMAAGIDPAAAKREMRLNRDDVASVVEQWLVRDQARNRSAKHVRQALQRHVLPRWRGRPIASVSRRDVLDLTDDVGDTAGPAAARNIHALLHRLFRWAAQREIVPASPMADLSLPGRAVSRDRVLEDAELATIWKAAAGIMWPFESIFQLLILTGARRDEIGSLRWSEIAGDTIRIPRERSKNFELRPIPINAPAAEIIKALPRFVRSDFVFSTTGTTAVSGWSRAKAALDAAATDINDGMPLAPWRTHDMRRSVATGLQRLGISLQAIEAVLGHVTGSRSGIVGTYQRYAFEPEARAALAAWGEHIQRIVSAGAASQTAKVLKTAR